LMAAWIWAVSSSAFPRGVTVEQIVDRTGMPPTPIIPGFQAVARSADRKALGSMLPGGETVVWELSDLVGSAALVATAMEARCAAGAVERAVPSTVPPPVVGSTFQAMLPFRARDTAAWRHGVDWSATAARTSGVATSASPLAVAASPMPAITTVARM